jgi:tetratricopeptide (TPR) repeat protein
MYGHAGRVKEAYKAYLKVLSIDPDYDYALKGIAWIAFSHDHNFEEARKIATYISNKRATPDMHLFLAQIAAAEKNTAEKNKQLAIFTKAATVPRYGDMYNKYLALLDAEELFNPSSTIAIAEREIHNRPTPQSYDLLAWGYFNSGNVKQALQIAQEHVVNHTWEPDAFYHLGMIYQANGMNDEAQDYFEKASTSYFELGPEKAARIKAKLSS